MSPKPSSAAGCKTAISIRTRVKSTWQRPRRTLRWRPDPTRPDALDVTKPRRAQNAAPTWPWPLWDTPPHASQPSRAPSRKRHPPQPAAPSEALGDQRGRRTCAPERPPPTLTRTHSIDRRSRRISRRTIGPLRLVGRPRVCAHGAATWHGYADRPLHAAAHARRVAPSCDRLHVASALPRSHIGRGRYFRPLLQCVSVTSRGTVLPSRHTRNLVDRVHTSRFRALLDRVGELARCRAARPVAHD